VNILRRLCRRSAAQTGFIGFTQSSQSLALGLALALLRSCRWVVLTVPRIPTATGNDCLLTLARLPRHVT
jgi:hypothetical protein